MLHHKHSSPWHLFHQVFTRCVHIPGNVLRLEMDYQLLFEAEQSGEARNKHICSHKSRTGARACQSSIKVNT